jgi:hypothetical protein
VAEFIHLPKTLPSLGQQLVMKYCHECLKFR